MPFTIVEALTPHSAVVTWSVTGTTFTLNVNNAYRFPLDVGDGWYVTTVDEELCMIAFRTTPQPETKYVHVGSYDRDVKLLSDTLGDKKAKEYWTHAVEKVLKWSSLGDTKTLVSFTGSSASIPIDLKRIMDILSSQGETRSLCFRDPDGNEDYLISYDAGSGKSSYYKIVAGEPHLV